MMKMISTAPKLILALVLTGFSSGRLAAQAAGNSVYTGHGYSQPVDLNINPVSYNYGNTLEASVMMNVKATAFVAVFSLTQRAATLEGAETALRERVNLFQGLLQTEQKNISSVFVDPISLVPTYELELTEKKFSKTYNEVPTGYEIKKNIHITFNRHDFINDLIAIAAKAEVYDLVKVSYEVEGLDQILQKLRQDALNILLQKKAAMELTGMHLRFKQVGEKFGSAHPSERYVQYTAFKTGAAPAFAVNKKPSPNQTVQYNYAEKNVTMYYDEVSDKQFDHVINPVVSEPMVQVYFSMKGQFESYDPEAEAAEKLYQQKLRQLQLDDMQANIDVKRRPAKPVKSSEKD